VKQTGFEPRLIELAGQINSAMPHAVVDKIALALNQHRKALNGSRVLIAGLSYKRDVSDIRESPSLDIMWLLKQRGVEVAYVDPFVPRLQKFAWVGEQELQAEPLVPETFRRFDCVAVLTDHSDFDWDTIVANSQLIVDTRDAIKGRYPHVYRLGAPPPSRVAQEAVAVSWTAKTVQLLLLWGVPRRIHAEASEFTRNSQVRKLPACDGNNVPDIGNYRDNSAQSGKTFTRLDGATILSNGSTWRLSIWGIHQIGADRWVQMSVGTASGCHELVLHMARASRSRDALTSIDQWLASPCPTSRVIHVF
jgi:hypothetical protein